MKYNAYHTDRAMHCLNYNGNSLCIDALRVVFHTQADSQKKSVKKLRKCLAVSEKSGNFATLFRSIVHFFEP